MNTDLRSIVRQHMQDKSLRSYLGDKFDSTSSEDKQRFLKEVESSIERQCEDILDAFIEDMRKGSLESKARKRRSFLVAIVSIIGTVGITVSVDQDSVIFTVLFAIIILIIQGYNINEEF